MLLRAARELDLDLSRSLMFGDRESDLQAAQAAGVQRRYLLATDGCGLPKASATVPADACFSSLAAAVEKILPVGSEVGSA